ncbi:hypothetical protein B0O99DRAFT_597121 [Bisporella sp. PMI_857]|nr:hypothetical protein B0O99DRAFT_597121 [Bisporella sp. PMI_857]
MSPVRARMAYVYWMDMINHRYHLLHGLTSRGSLWVVGSWQQEQKRTGSQQVEQLLERRGGAFGGAGITPRSLTGARTSCAVLVADFVDNEMESDLLPLTIDEHQLLASSGDYYLERIIRLSTFMPAGLRGDVSWHALALVANAMGPPPGVHQEAEEEEAEEEEEEEKKKKKRTTTTLMVRSSRPEKAVWKNIISTGKEVYHIVRQERHKRQVIISKIQQASS